MQQLLLEVFLSGNLEYAFHLRESMKEVAEAIVITDSIRRGQ